MYAVIKSGGKQYRVSEGDRLSVEKLNAEPGATVELEEVLMVVDGDKVTVGTPLVSGAKVTAEVLNHGRGDKVLVVKFKRRKQYHKRMGHRQDFTQLSIKSVSGGNAGGKSGSKSDGK